MVAVAIAAARKGAAMMGYYMTITPPDHGLAQTHTETA
jgi:hypothetical protein